MKFLKVFGFLTFSFFSVSALSKEVTCHDKFTDKVFKCFMIEDNFIGEDQDDNRIWHFSDSSSKCKKCTNNNCQNPCSVRYLNRDEREVYKVLVRDGKLYVREDLYDNPLFHFCSFEDQFNKETREIDGKNYVLLTTGKLQKKGGGKCFTRSKDGTAQIFVLDPKQNVIFTSFEATPGKFHHSTFLNGRAVLTAGELTVLDGVVKKINNKSGHYRPSKESLSIAIVLLKSQGVDTSKVVIEGISGK